MPSTNTSKKRQDLAEATNILDMQAHRTLIAARKRLLPDAAPDMDVNELARRVAQQLARLPKSERPAMHNNILMASQDLENLIGDLQSHMNEVARELRKLSSHSTAALAYDEAGFRRRLFRSIPGALS